MAFDFPASPSVGTIYSPAGGPTWQWNGTTWAATAPSGLVPEAPADGQNYVRRNGVWVLAPGTAEAKNRIVNGAMQISQENGDTASAVSAGSSFYPSDQWYAAWAVATGTLRSVRVSGSLGPAIGTQAYIALYATAATTFTAGSYASFNHHLEGGKIADFFWGGSSARQIVVRFWANHPKGGTFTFSIQNGAGDRSYLAPYTLPATVWTLITLIVPGDTTGTWPVDTSKGMGLQWYIGTGSTYTGVAGWQAGNKNNLPGSPNGVAAVNDGLSLTGVGLYLDPQNTGLAPPWQMPDEAQELAACKRYWDKVSFNMVATAQSAAYYASQTYPFASKRVAPALAVAAAGSLVNTSGVITDTATLEAMRVYFTSAASGTFAVSLAVINLNARM